jgi:hypothetical protein
MADTKISALTELSTQPDVADLVPVVDVSDTSMAASGTNKKVTASNFFGGAWAHSTPTASPSSGAFSNVTVDGYWIKIGKTVHYNFCITETDIGTGSGNLQLTLPSNAARSGYAGVGRDNAVNGKTICVFMANDTTINIFYYDNSIPMANGLVLYGSITYEAA